MRQLVYDVATSLDGFICGPEEDISRFPYEGEHVDAYLERLKGYDSVVMGRRTYEFGYRFGMNPGDKAYPHMSHHVFSRTLQLPQTSEIEVVREGWLERVDALKASDGGPIYLCGGGELAGYLLDHGRIDRLIVKLNPILLGEGVSLFGGASLAQPLRAVASERYASGVVLLTYDLD